MHTSPVHVRHVNTMIIQPPLLHQPGRTHHTHDLDHHHAHKINHRPLQVALRWVTQLGCPLAVSPGLNEDYAREDMNLGGFTLSPSEMASISGI